MNNKNTTIYRQWLILKKLPTRTRISTNGIRDKLINESGISVSLRTIQRDLNALAENFPLICDGEKEAGWSWSKDAAAFGISNMDPVTALTFKLVEKHLERMFPHGAMKTLEPFFKAANERMKQTAESSLSHWPDKIRVISRNLPMIYPQIPEDIQDKIYTAVLEEHRIVVTYRPLGAVTKEYNLNPLGIAFVEGLTYLIATINNHENPVTFALHRILEVKASDVPVVIPENFDLDESMEELKFTVGDDIKLQALFSDKRDVERLRETPVSEDQKITEKNGTWLLQATVNNSYQLRWWLRGYGERVEVIGPKNLRLEFVEMLNKLAATYQTKEIT